MADLQPALQLMLGRGALLHDDEVGRRKLSDVLRPEATELVYGEVTASLVSMFQKDHNLQSTGEVDEATAKAINALLDKWAVLAAPPDSKIRRLRGQITAWDDVPVAGLFVEAVERGIREEAVGGEGSTDAKGRYALEYTPGQIACSGVVVRAVQPNMGEVAASDIVFDPNPFLTIDLRLDSRLAPSEYERYRQCRAALRGRSAACRVIGR